jgi:hypothetical protein
VSAGIGDTKGTPGGCRLGCVIAIVGAFVFLAVAAVVGAGLSAITHQPAPSTSTWSTP